MRFAPLSGDGTLRLEAPLSLPVGRLDRLEIALPDKARASLAAAQRARGRLLAGEIILLQPSLSAFLKGSYGQALRTYGVERLQVRFGQRQVVFSGQLLNQGRRVLLTARGVLRPDPPALRLFGIRIYGFSPVPVPLAGHSLLKALSLAYPGLPDSFYQDGSRLDEVLFDPVRLFAGPLLVSSGYRLPDRAGVHVEGLRVIDGEFRLSLSSKGDKDPASAESTPKAGPLARGDSLLLAGDTKEALLAYEELAESAGGAIGDSALAIGARTRILEVLSSLPGRWEEALSRAQQELTSGVRPEALLVLATLHAERGQVEEAAEHYLTLADLADNAPEEVAAAALAASDLLLSRESSRAKGLLLLERAAGLQGGVAAQRALSRLTEEYTRAGRHKDIVALEERHLGDPDATKEEEQRRYLRLVQLYSEHLGDLDKAASALAKASSITDDNPAVYEARARLLLREPKSTPTEEETNLEEAISALQRAADLSLPESPEAAAENLTRAGQLAERLNQADRAIQHYRRALQTVSGYAPTLERLANLLLRQNRVVEAKSTFETLLEFSPSGDAGNALKRQALLALGKIALQEGDRIRAKNHLSRAMAQGGERDIDVLLGWAQLEEAEGHLDGLEKTLSKLEDLGVRDHLLRRAEVLLLLGRPAEAIHVSERLTQRGPEVLRLWARAYKMIGDTRGMREALEQLVQLTPTDQRVHLDLGRAYFSAGDLDSAREHLAKAGPEVEALELLCEVLAKKKDDKALASVLETLIASLAPDPTRLAARATALGRLAEIQGRLGQKAEALESLRRALDLLPQPGQKAPAGLSEIREARTVIGEAALQLGQVDEARAAWEPILSAPDANSAVRALRLGELAEREHPEAALRFYKMAQQSGAKDKEAARAWSGVIRLSGRVELLKNPGGQTAALEAQASALIAAAEDPTTEETQSARAALFCQAAEIRRKQGRTEESIGLYDRALRLDPEHHPALDALEILAEQSDQPARLAEVLTRKARALNGRPTDRKRVLGRLGTLYAQRLGRKDLARESFRQTLALDPTFRPGLLFLAEDARERGDTGAELAHLKRLAALSEEGAMEPSERAEIHARLAYLHRRAGRLEEAERQALLSLKLRPDHAQSLLLLEERYTQSERWAELCDILLGRSAVEADPLLRHQLLSRRAQILDERLRQPDKALHAYHDLVRTAPDPGACVRLATLALAQGAFEVVQDVAPVLGRTLLSSGKGEEAVAILAYATGRGGGEPLFALLAEAYEAVFDYDHAADAWSAAGRTADPERHAQALEQAGRLEEAMAAWVSVASSEPQLAEEARRRAVALSRRAMLQADGEVAQGVAWARRLLEVEPTDPEALVIYLGHQSLEELPSAVESLGRRMTVDEASTAWAQVAHALPESQVGHRVFLLRRVLAIFPTPEVYLALSDHLEGEERRALLTEGRISFPESAKLTLRLAETHEPRSALRFLQDVLAAPEAENLPPEGRCLLLIGAARQAAAQGDLAEARKLLSLAGDNEAALHEWVQIELSAQSRQGEDDSGLLRTLKTLRERSQASAAELRVLARLLTGLGDHRQACQVIAEAEGEPEELLQLVTGETLLFALREQAALRPTEARRLLHRAALLAENELKDRKLAAELLEQAAFSLGNQQDEAMLNLRAGGLWNALGQKDRGAAALGRALTAGGEKTPGALLALGDYAFDSEDWESAARHYRRAFAVGQVEQADRGRVRLRLAKVEHRRGNAQAEEQELAAAVEAGSGAQAWPLLAALFRAQGESAREGAALLAWADHESGTTRLKLLQKAASLVTPGLLPRVDDELTKLDADDEMVRDRIQARLRQANDHHGLVQALIRDVERSQGERRTQSARELANLCERMGDPLASAGAYRVVLESTTTPQRDCQEVLAWLSRMRDASIELPKELLATLRALLIQQGRLDEVIRQIDHQLEGRVSLKNQLELMQEAAELTESLGETEAAALRWARICTLSPKDPLSMQRARRCLRQLCDTNRAGRALQIIETELRRAGPQGASAYGLRMAQTEALFYLGKTDEAIGQLELVLSHQPDCGPAHALLGLMLAHTQQLNEIERGLPHLLRAAYAQDVEPAEAGECALLSAECLMRGFRKENAEDALDPRSPKALFERAAEMMPHDRRPLEGMLRLCIGAGQHEQAVLLIERLLDLLTDDRERARLLVDQSHILRHLGRPEGADAALQEALSLCPEMPAALHALRSLSLSRGDLSRAEALLRRELEATDDPAARVELFLDLGQLLEQRGDTERALEVYKQAGESGSPDGWQRVTRWYAEREDWLEAADAAGRAAELTPEDQRGLLFIDAAELALRAQDEPRARDYLSQALALGGSASDIAQHRLHMMDGGSDPQDRRRFLEGKLQESSGSFRIDLLRRLLQLLSEIGDDEAVLRFSRELDSLLPGDPLPFALRHRVFTSRKDGVSLCALWEERAKVAPDSASKAEALCQAASLRDEYLQDPGAAEDTYNQALQVHPGHLPAQLGAADLAYRRGDYDRARTQYRALRDAGHLEDLHGKNSSEMEGNRIDLAEIWRRLGELEETAAGEQEAEEAYTKMLELSEALAEPDARRKPRDTQKLSIVRAAEELTRIYELRGDYGAAVQALSRVLPHLPDGAGAEVVDRRVQVRLHLAWLTTQVGDPAGTRRHLQYLLVDSPNHRDGLTMLLEVYRRTGEYQLASEVLERLVRLARKPAERAELIYERGLLHEVHLGQEGRALELYQQAADLKPDHLPTLRRLVRCYLRTANGVGVAETVREMREAGADFTDQDEVQVMAGLGLALYGDDKEADVLLRDATADQLASALCLIQLPKPGNLAILDEPITAAIRALSGMAQMDSLIHALYKRLDPTLHPGLDLGARQILARLSELRGEASMRVHLGVLAFVDPTGYAQKRLQELPPPTPAPLREEAMPEGGHGPLRDVLSALGPLVLGVGPSTPKKKLQSSEEWEKRLRALAQSMGILRLEVMISPQDAPDLGDEPARVEPSDPPRLLLSSRVAQDESQARFATLRALYLLLFGVPLIAKRSAADVHALLCACAKLYFKMAPAPTPAMDAWIDRLAALSLKPEAIPPKQRELARRALQEIIASPSLIETRLPAFVSAAERAAERLAFVATMDLVAALRALRPASPESARTLAEDGSQAQALLRRPAHSELIAFADRHLGERGN